MSYAPTHSAADLEAVAPWLTDRLHPRGAAQLRPTTAPEQPLAGRRAAGARGGRLLRPRMLDTAAPRAQLVRATPSPSRWGRGVRLEQSSSSTLHTTTHTASSTTTPSSSYLQPAAAAAAAAAQQQQQQQQQQAGAVPPPLVSAPSSATVQTAAEDAAQPPPPELPPGSPPWARFALRQGSPLPKPPSTAPAGRPRGGGAGGGARRSPAAGRPSTSASAGGGGAGGGARPRASRAFDEPVTHAREAAVRGAVPDSSGQPPPDLASAWNEVLDQETHIYLAGSRARSVGVLSRAPPTRTSADVLRVQPATRPSNRSEAEKLSRMLDRALDPYFTAHAQASLEDDALDMADRVMSELARQMFVHTAERGMLLGRLRRAYRQAVASGVSRLARLHELETLLAEAEHTIGRLAIELQGLGATARSLHRRVEEKMTSTVLDKFALSEQTDARCVRRVLERLEGLFGTDRELAVYSLLRGEKVALDETLAVLASCLFRLERPSRCMVLHANCALVQPAEVYKATMPGLNLSGGWAALLHRLPREGPEMHRLAQCVLRAWEAGAPGTSERMAMHVIVRLDEQARLAVFDAMGAEMRGREVQLMRPLLDEAELLADPQSPDPVLAQIEAEEKARAERVRLQRQQTSTAEVGAQVEEDELWGERAAAEGAGEAEGDAGAPAGAEPGVGRSASLDPAAGGGGGADDDRPLAWAHRPSNVWQRWTSAVSGPARRLPLAEVIGTIGRLYAERLRGLSFTAKSSAGAFARATPFRKFVYMQLLALHGLKSTAARALRDLLEASRVHAPASARCHMFASLLGVLRDSEYDEGRITFFFDLLRNLLGPRRPSRRTSASALGPQPPGEAEDPLLGQLSAEDGALLVPNYPAAPVTRIICSAKELAEHSDELAEFIDEVATPHVVGGHTRGVQVDIDVVMRRTMEAYDLTIHESRQQLLAAFRAVDANQDGVLSLGEFHELCTRLYPHLRQPHVEELFVVVQTVSEQLDPNVGDALLPEAFLHTVLANTKQLAPTAPTAQSAAAGSRAALRRRGESASSTFIVPEDVVRADSAVRKLVTAQLETAETNSRVEREVMRKTLRIKPSLKGIAAVLAMAWRSEQAKAAEAKQPSDSADPPSSSTTTMPPGGGGGPTTA